MIEAPRITEVEQKQFRDEFITLIEQYEDQDALQAFRNEWDGAVNFQIVDDHTVAISIAGEEKLPMELKEKVRDMRNRFDNGSYSSLPPRLKSYGWKRRNCLLHRLLLKIAFFPEKENDRTFFPGAAAFIPS